MKLLVVEDDAGVRESMADVLSELAPVHQAACVEEAVAALRAERFSLALTDLHLDVPGGAQQVLLAARQALVPVALVSAAPQAEIAATLAPEAADACLSKPFDLEALLSLARHFLDLWTAVDQPARSQALPLQARQGLVLPGAGVVRVVSGQARVGPRPLVEGYLTRTQLASLVVEAPGELRFVADEW